VIFTASLFLPTGRWSEHLTTDTTCSVDCLMELCEFSPKTSIVLWLLMVLFVTAATKLLMLDTLSEWAGQNPKARKKVGTK